MKKVGVIYYTRSGNSQRVAEKIAGKLNCDLIQITDQINWKGLIGYLKAGFYSMTKRPVEIQLSGDLDGFEEYVVVGPLWAGGLAPSLVALLERLPREKVHLVVTSIGSLVEDRSGYLSVDDITRNSGNEDAVIEALVNSLRSA